MSKSLAFTTQERWRESATPVIKEEDLFDVSALTIGRCVMNLLEVLENYPAKVQLISVALVFMLFLKRCRFHASTLLERARSYTYRGATPEIRAAQLYAVNQINA